MLSQDEQIALFVDAINKNALKMRREIEKDTKKLYTDEADKLEKAAEKEMESKLSYAEKEISTQLNRQTAADKSDYRHKLYKRREELTSSVFENAKKKLLAFTQSGEYFDFLVLSLKKISAYTDGCFLIKVKPGDEASAKSACAEAGLCCEIQADKKITLGGVIAECINEGKIIDDTLDERLSQQKDWFLHHAGSELNI